MPSLDPRRETEIDAGLCLAGPTPGVAEIEAVWPVRGVVALR